MTWPPAFLIALCWGGSQQPWDSAATIAPLVVGGVGLGVTVVWEMKFAREPIFKPSLFNSTSSVVTYILGAAQGFLVSSPFPLRVLPLHLTDRHQMWGSFYYVPFWFMAVQQTSPLTAGVNLLPAVLVLVPGSVVTGRLVTRYDNYRVAMCVGWLLTSVSAALAVAWRFVDPVATAVWAVTLVFLGLGHGAVLNAQTWATQALCAPGDEGRAAAAYLFLRQFGAAVGVGVGGTVFQNVMAAQLRRDGLPAALAHDAEAAAAAAREGALPAGLAAGLHTAFVHGFAGVFQLYLAVAALAFGAALLAVRHVTLNKALRSDHTLVDAPRAPALLVGRPAAARARGPPPKPPRSRSSGESTPVSSSEAETVGRPGGEGPPRHPHWQATYGEVPPQGWQPPALHDQRYAPSGPQAAVVGGEPGRAV